MGDQFEKFIQACEVLFSVHSSDVCDAKEPVELLRRCQEQMTKVDTRALSKLYSGRELGAKIKEAQLKKISEVMQSS